MRVTAYGLKPGGLRGLGGWRREAGGPGAVRSLFTPFPPCHGRTGVTVSEGRGVGDDAVICMLRQRLELHGEGGDRNAAVAGSPRLLLLGRALLQHTAPGPKAKRKTLRSKVLPRGDESPLFMSSSVPRNGMIDSRPGSLCSRACPMPLAGGKVTGHPEENHGLCKPHSCAGGPPAGPSLLP